MTTPDGYAGPISIHAPREGSDSALCGCHRGPVDFYPRSPRGERPSPFGISLTPRGISIHAPREGSDGLQLLHPACLLPFLSTLPARGATVPTPPPSRSTCYFYPRSPRGERRKSEQAAIQRAEFLSTLPARGATDQVRSMKSSPFDFYPRSPRGERLRHSGIVVPPGVISIHAPREGSDPPVCAASGPTI